MESIDHALDTYCRHVMTEMGTDTTSTSALDHYGRTHFPAHFFAGVYPADREPPPPTGTDFYIQNTEPASHPGTHWVAIARVPGYPDLLFDSFARKPSHVFLPHLMGRVESTRTTSTSTHATARTAGSCATPSATCCTDTAATQQPSADTITCAYQ